MMAVDTSALMAILLEEERGPACAAALKTDDDVIVSAGTVAEALVVAARRNVSAQMLRLIEDLGIEVVPVTLGSAQRVAEAYARWGKGVHPAALNLGDCFAYTVAKDNACQLLYVGKDFARTDLESVL
jgi:ribonuclease VapC